MHSRLARSVLAATTAALLLIAPAAALAARDKAGSADVKDGARGKDGAAKDAKIKAKKDDAAAKTAEAVKKAEAEKVAAKKAETDKAAAKKAEAEKAAAKKAETEKIAAKKAETEKAKVARKHDAAKHDAAKVAKKDEAREDDAVKGIKGTASVGAPNNGRLVRGVKLRSSRSLKVRERAQTWGVPGLVKLLQRAAGKVAKHHPRSVMLIGDLSQKSGGAMTGHNSHQSGRDADVGFYVANSKGKPAAMKRFVAFDGTGRSTQVTWAQFDDERNWALVEALITDKETPVRYIFVSAPLRNRVLAHASRKKVAKDLYTRAASVLLAPRDADVHDDHFHVRIACPEAMKGHCQEESRGRPGGPIAKATKTSDSAIAASDGAKPATAAPADEVKPVAAPIVDAPRP